MPRLETVNVPPESSDGVIDPFRTRAASAPVSGRDLAQSLAVRVEHGRHDEGLAGRDSHADVDSRVFVHPPVPVGAVDAWELAQRGCACLDHDVVGRRDGVALARRLDRRPASTAGVMSITVSR